MNRDEVIVYFRNLNFSIDRAIFNLQLIVELHHGLAVISF